MIVHSGLQFGGLPMNVGRHEQDGVPPTSRHCAFEPQGDGTHGLIAIGLSIGDWGAEGIIQHTNMFQYVIVRI